MKKNITSIKGLLGRNEKGQFVNLSKVSVSAKETKTAKTKKVKAAETAEAKPEVKAEAKPKKEKKAKGPVVVITSAMYGSAEKSIEVAAKMIVGRKITNKLAGEDPAPKVKKVLVVKATVDGSPVEKTFNEGDKLTF